MYRYSYWNRYMKKSLTLNLCMMMAKTISSYVNSEIFHLQPHLRWSVPHFAGLCSTYCTAHWPSCPLAASITYYLHDFIFDDNQLITHHRYKGFVFKKATCLRSDNIGRRLFIPNLSVPVLYRIPTVSWQENPNFGIFTGGIEIGSRSRSVQLSSSLPLYRLPPAVTTPCHLLSRKTSNEITVICAVYRPALQHQVKYLGKCPIIPTTDSSYLICNW